MKPYDLGNTSNVNHLLNLGINADHPCVKIRVISHQDIWIPCCGYENGIDATTDWGHENLAYLKANKEREGHDNGGEFAAFIVGWIRELKIEKGKEGAKVGYKCGSHR